MVGVFWYAVVVVGCECQVTYVYARVLCVFAGAGNCIICIYFDRNYDLSNMVNRFRLCAIPMQADQKYLCLYLFICRTNVTILDVTNFVP